MAENQTGVSAAQTKLKVGPRDNIMAFVSGDTGNVISLVFSSADRGANYERDNGAWWKMPEGALESFEDPEIYLELVDLDFVDFYDKTAQSNRDGNVPFYSYDTDNEAKPVTAAAGDCPPATQDIALNLKNRENAIDTAGYGPLNPAKPNNGFWSAKAEKWSVTIDEAKGSTCGNCAAFFVTTDVLQCIADGLSAGGGSEDSWDVIDAGQLGYCEAFDFKCAAARTCDAWVTGGPIDDDAQKGREKS